MDKRKISRIIRRTCRRCLRANGECIRHMAYIGLCAKEDKEELLEEVQKHGKKNIQIQTRSLRCH